MTRPVLLRCWIVRLCVLVSIASPASGLERILNYDSVVRIEDDGGLSVTETIRVEAEGAQIRRGIYRDFPTRYRDRSGRRVTVPFDVVSVLRDGSPEPWHTERIAGGQRLYAGSANVFLDPGEYTYTLTYETDRQIGHFDGFDELYWNVTGNGWGFPIEAASAEIHLPAPVSESDLRYEAYTGPEGARERNYRASLIAPGIVRFETTERLWAGQGITVVVGFPKGLVPEPTTLDKSADFVRDNLGIFLGVFGAFAAFAWYFLAWNRVGRDPAAGPVYPRYEAPKRYSPGLLRYIWKMGYDKTCIAAAMIEMAVDGTLRLERDGKTWIAERGEGAPASRPEQVLHQALFAEDDRIEFRRGEHVRVGSAVRRYQAALRGRAEKKYFRRNGGWTAIGVLISVLTAFFLVALVPTDQPGIGIILGVFLLVFGTMNVVLTVGIVRSWRQASGIAGTFRAGFHTLFSLPFLAITLGAAGVFAWLVGFVPLLVLIALLAVNVVFWELMRAPTLKGRGVLDAIEGLRLYLGVAERQDIEQRHGEEPPRTIDEFERMLPYAIALDAAETWADRFSEAIRAAEIDGTARSRSWYSASMGSSGSGNFTAQALTSSLATGLASGISSSARAPGSSSGGGGGGSSGGGGGGGGGGGW